MGGLSLGMNGAGVARRDGPAATGSRSCDSAKGVGPRPPRGKCRAPREPKRPIGCFVNLRIIRRNRSGAIQDDLSGFT